MYKDAIHSTAEKILLNISFVIFDTLSGTRFITYWSTIQMLIPKSGIVNFKANYPLNTQNVDGEI